jgi:hypothetical protein
MDLLTELFEDPSYGARPLTDRMVLIFTDGDATLNYNATNGQVFGGQAELNDSIANMLVAGRAEVTRSNDLQKLNPNVTTNVFELYTMAWVDTGNCGCDC